MIAMTRRFSIFDFLARDTASRVPEAAHETEAQRRAWVQEMLCANPEALGSDHDLGVLLGEYPGPF